MRNTNGPFLREPHDGILKLWIQKRQILGVIMIGTGCGGHILRYSHTRMRREDYIGNPYPTLASTWVVVKMMVPFWIPIMIHHPICRVPKKGPSFCQPSTLCLGAHILPVTAATPLWLRRNGSNGSRGPKLNVYCSGLRLRG